MDGRAVSPSASPALSNCSPPSGSGLFRDLVMSSDEESDTQDLWTGSTALVHRAGTEEEEAEEAEKEQLAMAEELGFGKDINMELADELPLLREQESPTRAALLPLTSAPSASASSQASLALAADHKQLSLCAAEHATARESAVTGGSSAAARRQGEQLPRLVVILQTSSFDLGIQVEPRELAQAVPNSHLSHNSRVTVRSLRSPRWAAVVNRTGLVRIHSQATGDAARLVAKRMARLVQKRYSASARFKKYKAQVLTSLAHVGFKVDLQGLAQNIVAEGVKVVNITQRLLVLKVTSKDEEIPTTVQVHKTGNLRILARGGHDASEAAVRVILPLVRKHGFWW